MAGLGVTINTKPSAEPNGKSPGTIVEMSIPWSELPGTRGAAKPGDVVHGLLAMSYVSGTRQSPRQAFIAHLPTLASFHNVACFSPYELTD